MSETNDLRRTLLAVSKLGSRLFRNNVAQAVVGKAIWIKRPGAVEVEPGDCVVRNARVLHAGLIEGSGDLIGWTPLVITPEMVGKTVAVFTSIEGKDAVHGRVRTEQEKWDRVVKQAGGISGVAYGPSDAVDLIKNYRPK